MGGGSNTFSPSAAFQPRRTEKEAHRLPSPCAASQQEGCHPCQGIDILE